MSDTPNAAVKRRLIGGDDGRLTKRQKGDHGAPISSEVAISQEQACNASSSRKASPMPSGHQDSPSSMQRCEKAEETKDTDSGNIKTIDSGVEGRQEKINLKLFSVPFTDRVKAYHILYDCKSQDEHRNMMIEVRKIGEEVYAQTLHDSPAGFRQVQLTKDLEENSDSDMHRRLIRNITELSVQRDIADPCQIIPPVVTKQSLEVFLKRERKKGDKRVKVTCHCCNEEFCSLEGLHDVQNVVWKLCGKHVMHEQCFIDAVRKGSIPLYGRCGCEDLIK